MIGQGRGDWVERLKSGVHLLAFCVLTHCGARAPRRDFGVGYIISFLAPDLGIYVPLLFYGNFDRLYDVVCRTGRADH